MLAVTRDLRVVETMTVSVRVDPLCVRTGSMNTVVTKEGIEMGTVARKG